uniref:NADH-ubiquinone oxidoreductase chain 5 n=1 Tax=Platycnemis foliacea TaxID=1041950 RepID=A0A0F7DHC0_9ODON|nr:NADH dehydrogenase subunit 5 [Platycnemis foliacea]AKH04359.1 NADH dehydrogenase subunit 5 [Platycnemis foliacea]
MYWRSMICNISFIFLFFFSSVFFFFGLYFSVYNICYFVDWEVFCLNSTSIVMTFLFDWVCLFFMSLVLFISSMVIFYSAGYMEGDIFMLRFVFLVLLFVLSMMLLIVSPNLISILLGWDGLGLISYLLVIYYQNFKSFSAGMLTVLSNRLGDVAFLIGIAWMLNFGSWNYVFYVDFLSNSIELKIISFLMIFAAMTKSAQIPFSSWLPAAMAAPTPVSALVHSSTLVTAGVYLMIRFNPLIISTGYSSYLLLIGGMTMFMSGLGANFEFDLKKIIALSTLSQLGLMMSILSMGLPDLAFFHLMTHALFKALLFMCAGVIIHNLGDCQDIRFMGGLINYLPLTSMCFCISNLALCGMPFLAGFYSKDLILEVTSMSFVNMVSFMFYFVSTGLTACYTIRLLYFVMFGDTSLSSSLCISDENWFMLKGMLGMVFMAVLGGSLISWIVFPAPSMICLPFFLKTLAFLVTFLGAGIGYLFSGGNYNYNMISIYYTTWTYFVGSMWFMPFISTKGFVMPFLSSGSFMTKSFDHGWCETFGGQGIFNVIKSTSLYNQLFQFNLIKTYLMSFIFFVLFWLMMF